MKKVGELVKEAKGSNGKIIGTVEISEDSIIVEKYNKPKIEIKDVEIVNSVKKQNIDFAVVLYDKYELCIGEIAALYDMPYCRMNKINLSQNPKTGKSHGRRNSSYHVLFSEERRRKIGESTKGRKPSEYERTPEIRKQISETLKRKYASGEIYNDPKKFSEAWARGCYDTAKMGRGIQGYMYSIKCAKDVYFRSLLELNYYILFEENEDVVEYKVEPFLINISETSHYLPDALVNGKFLVEIKSEGHLRYTDKDRFEKEVEAATKYCNENNLEFVVLYDTRIGFSTAKYKMFLRDNPDVIRRYNIRFNDGADAIKLYWQK